VARGEALLEVGDVVEVAAVVLAGVMREVYVDREGQERTRSFSFAGDFVGSWADTLTQRPSRTRVEALEPSTVRVFPVAAVRALEARSPELRHALRCLAELLYVRKSDREFELLTFDAAARYRALLLEHPDIEGRVQLQHIASYLGITPVYFSRLRRRSRAGASRRPPR
jgi:CRP-like cAMP-binding protein